MLRLTSCVSSDFPAAPSEARELARLLDNPPDGENEQRHHRYVLTVREAMICAAALRRM